MNITSLRIPTGRRQTSWLFTSAGYREQYQLAVRMGFEPATYGFQIWRSNHLAMQPQIKYYIAERNNCPNLHVP